MRSVLVVLVLAGSAWSQAFTEATAAIAGGSVGGVAGKKVSDGITNVFQNVDATAKKAAKTGNAPATAVQKVTQARKTGESGRSADPAYLQFHVRFCRPADRREPGVLPSTPSARRY